MKTKKIFFPAMCIIPLLSSCASYQTGSNVAFGIKPVYSVKNSADSPNSQYQVGRYYQGQQRYELAAAAYRKALMADSTYVEARNGLAVVYSMQGMYEQAIVELKMAVSQAPMAAHIYNNLGHALYLHGEYAEAATTLEKAVALDPQNQRTLNNLGLAYAKAGDMHKSQQSFDAAANPVQPEETKNPVLLSQPNSLKPEIPEKVPAVQAASISPDPAQVLALPKDRGVISHASGILVANAESHMETVKVAPNVYELRERTKQTATPVAVMDKAPPVLLSKAVLNTLQPIAKVPQTTVLPVSKAVVVAAPPPAIMPELAKAPSKSMDVPIESARFRIEISNGNGTNGMASKVASYLRGNGYTSARLTNLKPYIVKTTQIQYRVGQQQLAEKMRANLPGNTEVVQSDNLRADIKLRVVLGKDIVSHTAYFDGKSQKLRFARNGLDS